MRKASNCKKKTANFFSVWLRRKTISQHLCMYVLILKYKCDPKVPNIVFSFSNTSSTNLNITTQYHLSVCFIMSRVAEWHLTWSASAPAPTHLAPLLVGVLLRLGAVPEPPAPPSLAPVDRSGLRHAEHALHALADVLHALMLHSDSAMVSHNIHNTQPHLFLKL